MTRLRVYISGPISTGPISKGNLLANIKQATDAAKELMVAKFAVLCPHLTCHLDGSEPKALPGNFTHDEWIANDLAWVQVSDAILRLPGESVGADEECEHARRFGIPVYRDIKTLVEHPPVTKEKSVTVAGHQGYLGLLTEMRALHVKKSLDYGTGTDPLANLRASSEIGIPPWLGAWLRAKDKVKRIDQYCRVNKLANESVEDSLMDLAAYALLSLALIRESVTASK